MLDGIDEGGEFKPRIEHFVTTFLVRQRISLIATTRPEGYTKALYEENFERFSLAPLDRPQQEQIIENRLGPDACHELARQLDSMNDSEGKSICNNPLMLSMVISIFQNGGGVLPSSRFELYEKALSTMLTRVDFKQLDAREDADEVPDPRAIEELLRLIAVHRHFDHDKNIMPDAIESVVRDDKALRHAWQHVEAKVIAGRLPVLSCLEPTPLKLQFAHLSFQEFLVSKQFVRYCEKNERGGGRRGGSATTSTTATTTSKIPPLATLLGDPWWHNTVRMACEASGAAVDTIMVSHTPNVHLYDQQLKGDAIFPLMFDCRLLTHQPIHQLVLSRNSLSGAW